MWSENAHFVDGELEIAGCPVTRLAQEFGTPLFVMDENDFRHRAQRWKKALESNFAEHAGTVYYAAKAFLCVEVARWVNQEGLGLDVCSGGELAVALAANFPASKIELHGNNKSEEELHQAISAGVGTIVVDSLIEIDRISHIAGAAKKSQKILLRITPGVEAHTHEAIATAHEDVKFGFSIASGAAWNAIVKAQAAPNIHFAGLHCHIGSQIFNSEGFELAGKKLVELLARYKNEFGSELPELDMGGGYGIAYTESEKTFDPDNAMSHLATIIRNECHNSGLKIPSISIEPGRAIVGPTTCTLYEVGTTKEVRLDHGATRHYVSIDGGMSDNIRPALYGAVYSVAIANRSPSSRTRSSRIVGKHCETGDIVIHDVALADDVQPGDLLAIPATGAYGRSMASNYNHLPRPAVVAVTAGSARVILRRESTADLLALDVVEPPRSMKRGQ